MKGLSAAGLADLAGGTEAEVERLVELGVLVARDGADPFRETDVQKVRLAAACEQAGLPMAGIRPHRQPGRPDRRLCQRQSGPGERARDPDSTVPGCDLRRAGLVQLEGIAHPVRLLEAHRA
jgi:hypothetical protein